MTNEIVTINFSEHMHFVCSVFEKVVVFLDKFYDGDLPLRNESEIIKKLKKNSVKTPLRRIFITTSIQHLKSPRKAKKARECLM